MPEFYSLGALLELGALLKSGFVFQCCIGLRHLYERAAELRAKDRVSVEEFVSKVLENRLASREYIEARAKLFHGREDYALRLPMNCSDRSFFGPYGILNYSGCVPHAPFGPCEQGP